MVTLADFSDTQFQMTCKRCEQTLQEGDRFCRYCGQDQLEGDPSAVIDITQPASNGDGGAFEPMSTQRAARRQAWREPASSQGIAGPPDTPDGRPGGAAAPSRWSMGLAAAVLLGLAAVLSYDLYLSRQEDATRQTVAQQPGGAAHDQADAAAVTRPPAPAAPTSTSVASPEAPAEPAPVVADGKPTEAVAQDASASAAAPPPAPAPTATPAIPASPAPATSFAVEPAARAAGQGACPAALAAMALCANQ